MPGNIMPDLVTVKAKNPAKDSAGGIVPNYKTSYQNIAASVQLGQDVLRGHHEFFFCRHRFFTLFHLC